MIFKNIKPHQNRHFGCFYKAYQEAFPAHERRDISQAKALLHNPLSQILALQHGSQHIAYAVIWKLKYGVFIEHLLVLPTYQSKGLGRKIIKKIKEINHHVVLECEHQGPDWVSQARLRFYHKLGFCIISENYQQPPYGAEKPWVNLCLLSTFSPSKTQDLVQEIYQKIYEITPEI